MQPLRHLPQPEAESNQNRACFAQIESITLVLQIALFTLVLCCSRLYCKLFSPNQIESTTMHVPQSNHTTPLTPRHMRARTHLTHILEGARACGKAVPGRHSRLCQSNTSAHPEVTCKGTTTIKHHTITRLDVIAQNERHEPLKRGRRGRKSERCTYPFIMPARSDKCRLVDILLTHTQLMKTCDHCANRS